MRYFSPSTKAFYGEEHGNNKPNDCVEVTQAEYDAVKSYDAIAKELSSDANGKPILVDKVDNRSYDKKRKTEYPSIGDQLDALFHAGVFPTDMAAQIQAIKDKYPKG